MKPIIHFYSSLDDVAIPYLEKYPFALLINQNDHINRNVIKIIGFIESMNQINHKESVVQIFLSM